MNVFELIKEKLEEMKTKSSHMEILAGIYYENALEDAISIVDEVAQEYKHCELCYLGSPCEYQNENIKMPVSAPYKEGHTDEYIKGYNQGTIDRADEIQKAREYGYNKAIDEFAEKLKVELDKKYSFGGVEKKWELFDSFDEIAEQLKGGSDDR